MEPKRSPAISLWATSPRQNSEEPLPHLRAVSRRHAVTNAISVKSKASIDTRRRTKADGHLPMVNAKAVIWPGIISPVPSEALPSQLPKKAPSLMRKQPLEGKDTSRDEEMSVKRHSPSTSAVLTLPKRAPVVSIQAMPSRPLGDEPKLSSGICKPEDVVKAKQRAQRQSPAYKVIRELPNRLPGPSRQATPTHPSRNGLKMASLLAVPKRHGPANVISTKLKTSNNACKHAKADGHLEQMHLTMGRAGNKAAISDEEQNATQCSPKAKAALMLPNRSPISSIRALSHSQVKPCCLSKEPKWLRPGTAKPTASIWPTNRTVIRNEKPSNGERLPAAAATQTLTKCPPTRAIECPGDTQELPSEPKIGQELASPQSQALPSPGEVGER
jgi:hypothetical protein